MRRRNRGANAIEFAILLPVFVLLLGGSIDLSWMMLQRGAMRTAVGRGCRIGSLVDPGLKEANVSAVHAQAQAAIEQIYEEGVGTCTDCVVATAIEGAVPNRSLRCTLTAPWNGGLASTLSGFYSGTLTDEAVSRLEFQREP